MFYDMICPDSKAAHYTWKGMWDKPSPVEGKTYSQLVDMHVTPYILPYHLHSYQLAELFPMLTDLCASNTDACYQDRYAELCWDHLDNSSLHN